VKTIHGNISQISVDTGSEHRERVDVLRSRVGLLDGKDRVLMTMYIENGNSFRQMAKLTGVREETVARRIRRVTKRLMNGEYVMCMRNRDKLGWGEMEIAKDYFLTGLSIKKIARKRKATYYGIRQILKRIEAIISR